MTYARPMLSPVLEHYAPPTFRGNMPDVIPPVREREAEKHGGSRNSTSSRAKSSGIAGSLGSMYESCLLKLMKWGEGYRPLRSFRMRKRRVRVHKLHKKARKTGRRGGRRKAGSKPAIQSFNPCYLLGKVRDAYVNLMKGMASGGNLTGIGMGNYHGVGAIDYPGRKDMSCREYDNESVVQLSRTSSQADNTRYSRTSSKAESVQYL